MADIRDNKGVILATERGGYVYNASGQLLGSVSSAGTFDSRGVLISTSQSIGLLVR